MRQTRRALSGETGTRRRGLLSFEKAAAASAAEGGAGQKRMPVPLPEGQNGAVARGLNGAVARGLNSAVALRDGHGRGQSAAPDKKPPRRALRERTAVPAGRGEGAEQNGRAPGGLPPKGEKTMPHLVEITDPAAPELDVYARLTEAQLRSRRETEKGVFIAESLRVVENALQAGYEPLSLLLERRHITGQAAPLLERIGDIPVYTADSGVLAQLTGYQLTRGILGAFRRPALPSVEAVCASARRVAVLENIVDAANVGAIFRSAAALHMDAVLVTPSCCDPFCRRSVRVSMGTVCQVPWTYIGEKADQWPQPGLTRLRALGFHTAALALSDTALRIDDPRLAAEEKLAVVLGTEGDGLTPRTVAACDDTVCIPMSHGVDSLNVAAASAVAFWQLRRG